MDNRLEGAQTNGNGEIALRCVKEGQFLITGCPSGKEYVAITQVGICLVWVDQEDAAWIMNNKMVGVILSDPDQAGKGSGCTILCACFDSLHFPSSLFSRTISRIFVVL